MLGVSMGHLMNNISSYDTNIMLAAIISLLLVILFVLLLHIYAKWFLTLTRHTQTSSSSSSTSVTISYSLRPSTFHHTFHSSSSSPSKGLDPSLVASIPLFVCSEELEEDQEGSLECAICLSVFEANEIGRRLTKCSHCFHVECIDMWLHSHLNCPICRAPAAEIGRQDQIKSSQEIVIELQNIDHNSVVNYDSLSSPSPSPSPTAVSSSSSSMGCSNLKRMLSRNNRSESCKVIPSVNNELGV